MLRDEPAWWYGDGRAAAAAMCLQPAAIAYGAVAVARYRFATPYRSKLPVICIGNFTAGGTGKTPIALHVAERLKALGERPVILTRGYGGRAKGPLRVDLHHHTAAETGDEPLLLARSAPVLLARDRKAGAQAIEAWGDEASVIVMDDGMQNPSLVKDLTIAVADGRRGIGNGRVIPAGPLRAPLKFQLALANAIVINSAAGTNRHGAPAPRVEEMVQRIFPGPVLHAQTGPAGDTCWLKGARLVAYAGIGNPDRFFDLLSDAETLITMPFRDHQPLTPDDARGLLAKAEAAGATLITTEKDWVRLPDSEGPRAELKQKSRVLVVRTVFDGESEALLDKLIVNALAARPVKASGF